MSIKLQESHNIEILNTLMPVLNKPASESFNPLIPGGNLFVTFLLPPGIKGLILRLLQLQRKIFRPMHNPEGTRRRFNVYKTSIGRRRRRIGIL